MFRLDRWDRMDVREWARWVSRNFLTQCPVRLANLIGANCEIRAIDFPVDVEAVNSTVIVNGENFGHVGQMKRRVARYRVAHYGPEIGSGGVSRPNGIAALPGAFICSAPDMVRVEAEAATA